MKAKNAAEQVVLDYFERHASADLKKLVDAEKKRIDRRDLSRKILKVADGFDFGKAGRSGSLSAVLPTCVDDLVREGEAMDNCLGRMGYALKIASGESLVIFIRTGGKPYADCEISLDGVPAIRQLYAKWNLSPSPAVSRFAESLLRVVRKEVRARKRAEKGAAK